MLLAFGGAALALAVLSIGDLALPRPWDGVVLASDVPGTLLVSEVVAGSGADRAGIRRGDRIVGVDRYVLRSTGHAAELLARRRIGAVVPYLVRRGDDVTELEVELGRRYLGSASYFFACLLGFAFYGVGLFVLLRQRALRAAQIFFLVCVLFLLFLVCRLRPVSYSWVDGFLLGTGTGAMLFLPASFLHFFLVFPQPVALRPRPGEPDFRRRRRRWLATLLGIYWLPPLVLATSLAFARLRGGELRLISGVPLPNWWLLATYMLIGLGVLAGSFARIVEPRQRRGVALVLVGSLLGLLPFLATAVALPDQMHSERYVLVGLVPLLLVPLTFAFAIVRFGLLDIRVILGKSLAYTAITAVITIVYALAIALANVLTRGTALAASPWFPLLFALAIVLLFEPLRRRSQAVVDRLVYAERGRLQEAMRQLGSALAAEVDGQAVVRDLVERLPQLLGLHFAALYLIREGRLVRVAGPSSLPEELPVIEALHLDLARRQRLTRLSELALDLDTPGLSPLRTRLAIAGVELLGDLTSPRRRIGLVLLSGTAGQLTLAETELGLLDSLLHQAAMALETSLLLAERTQQAELERELEIASAVQNDLLPAELSLGPGWRVAAACRPARHVGGDFFAQLPGPRDGTGAILFGDVAGKSVAGALVMMAAHEALQTLALTYRDPATLLGLANQRLYRLGPKKSFVAVAYVAASADGAGLDYLLAGQPQLLLRRTNGEVTELPLPEHRLPLGALLDGGYRACHAPIAAGDVVLGYSDGVTDAQSPRGEPFGGERLAAVLAGGPAEPQAVVDGVLAAVRRFTEGAEPYDDITLVAITRDRQEVPCATVGGSLSPA